MVEHVGPNSLVTFMKKNDARLKKAAKAKAQAEGDGNEDAKAAEVPAPAPATDDGMKVEEVEEP
eukprot:SAG31_NODE_9757_length_1232_cov_83.887908_1_plen_64_part_00